MRTRNIILLLVLGLSVAVAAANPAILHRESWGTGHWYNDRDEERTREMSDPNTTWNTISYPNPWIVEVTNPQLEYDNYNHVFDDGENITIVQGGVTITLTASTTVTLTVN